MQWDAVWHLSIALDGYGLNPKTFAFPPGFGWLLRAVTDVELQVRMLINGQTYQELLRSGEVDLRILSLRWAAILNTTFFFVGNTLGTRLISARFSLSLGRVLAAFLANPFAYFTMLAYADPLYHMLFWMILTLWCATSERAESWGFRPVEKLRRWPKALMRSTLALSLFMLPWVRLNAYALVGIAIGAKNLNRSASEPSDSTSWAKFRFGIRWEAFALVASALCFLAYNWWKTDRPFFFLFAQRVYGMPEGNFLNGLGRATSIFVEGLSGDAWIGTELLLHWFSFGVLPLLFLVGLLILSLQLWRHREFALSAIVVFHILITHNQAIWRSTPRYALPLVALALLLPLLPIQSVGRRTLFALGLGLGWAMQVSYYATLRAGGWGF